MGQPPLFPDDPSIGPLAERMRPGHLDEFVGHAKVVGEGTLIRTAIEQNGSSRLTTGAESCLEEIFGEHNDMPNGAPTSYDRKRRPIHRGLLTKRSDQLLSVEGNLEPQPLQCGRDGCSYLLVATKSGDQMDLP